MHVTPRGGLDTQSEVTSDPRVIQVHVGTSRRNGRSQGEVGQLADDEDDDDHDQGPRVLTLC